MIYLLDFLCSVRQLLVPKIEQYLIKISPRLINESHTLSVQRPSSHKMALDIQLLSTVGVQPTQTTDVIELPISPILRSKKIDLSHSSEQISDQT